MTHAHGDVSSIDMGAAISTANQVTLQTRSRRIAGCTSKSNAPDIRPLDTIKRQVIVTVSPHREIPVVSIPLVLKRAARKVILRSDFGGRFRDLFQQILGVNRLQHRDHIAPGYGAPRGRAVRQLELSGYRKNRRVGQLKLTLKERMAKAQAHRAERGDG